MHKNSTALTSVPEYNNMYQYQGTTDKLFYIGQYWSIAFKGKKYLCITNYFFHFYKEKKEKKVPDPGSQIPDHQTVA